MGNKRAVRVAYGCCPGTSHCSQGQTGRADRELPLPPAHTAGSALYAFRSPLTNKTLRESIIQSRLRYRMAPRYSTPTNRSDSSPPPPSIAPQGCTILTLISTWLKVLPL